MRLNNLTDLADLLRSLNNDEPTDGMGFDMCYTIESSRFTSLECGSACCIGGWVQHCNPELRGYGLVVTVSTLLPEPVKFGSETWKEIDELCYPKREKESYVWDATPQQAARAVEILRDTGKCDWDRAITEVAA